VRAGFDTALRGVRGGCQLARQGSQRGSVRAARLHKLPKELGHWKELGLKPKVEACGCVATASARQPCHGTGNTSSHICAPCSLLCPGTLQPNTTTRRQRARPGLPAFLPREKRARQALNKELLKRARTEKNNSKIKCSYPLTL